MAGQDQNSNLGYVFISSYFLIHFYNVNIYTYLDFGVEKIKNKTTLYELQNVGYFDLTLLAVLKKAH